MDVDTTLANLFVEAHPAESARLLEHMPSEVVAGLLGELPDAAAATLLGHLTHPKGVEILKSAESLDSGVLLGSLPPHQAAALLRKMPADERQRNLEVMAPENSEMVHRLLRHPEGTAGSLMDPTVTPLSSDLTVADARTLLRRATLRSAYYVYIVNREGGLIGVLNLRQLSLAPSKSSLAERMHQPAVSIKATADRGAILAHPGWARLHALPVVDRENRFLGVLAHEALRH